MAIDVGSEAIRGIHYLRREIRAAIEREKEHPKVDPNARAHALATMPATVSGYPIDKSLLENRADQFGRNKRLKTIADYESDKTSLKSDLDKLSISATFLPEKAFAALRHRVNYYELSPDQNGRVNISSSIVRRAEDDARGPRKRYVGRASRIVAVIVGAIAAALFAAAWFHSVGWAVPGLLFAALAFGAWRKGPEWLAWPGYRDFVAERVRWHTLNKGKDLMTHLLPNLRTPTNGPEIRVGLPKPMQIGQLVALQGAFRFANIAAPAKSIRFLEDVAGALCGRQSALPVGESGAEDGDAIIYLKHESAVAIIEVVGEFPFDNAMIDEVLNSIELV